MKSQLQYHHYISIPEELDTYQIVEEMGFWKKAGQFSVKSLEHILNPESCHPSHLRISPFLLILHLMIPLRDIHKSHLSITLKNFFSFSFQYFLVILTSASKLLPALSVDAQQKQMITHVIQNKHYPSWSWRGLFVLYRSSDPNPACVVT